MAYTKPCALSRRVAAKGKPACVGMSPRKGLSTPKHIGRGGCGLEPRFVIGTVVRYFVHGFALNLLSVVIAFFMLLLTVLLVLFGSLIGLVIGIVIWLFMFGGANAVLTGTLWFRVKAEIGTTVAHGLLLLVCELPLNLVTFYFVLGAQGTGDPLTDLTLWVAAIVGFATPQGYIAKRVAAIWRAGPERRVAQDKVPAAADKPREPSNPMGFRCPSCHSDQLVVASDGSALCLNCGRGILSKNVRRPPA